MWRECGANLFLQARANFSAGIAAGVVGIGPSLVKSSAGTLVNVTLSVDHEKSKLDECASSAKTQILWLTPTLRSGRVSAFLKRALSEPGVKSASVA